MKNNKGFTLIELLAVIVILGIIMTIVTTSVVASINESKKKAKYIAAKDITSMVEAYMQEKNISVVDKKTKISIKAICEAGYIEKDATNPWTGENIESCSDFDLQFVQVYSDTTENNTYNLKKGSGTICEWYYRFNGYRYCVKGVE